LALLLLGACGPDPCASARSTQTCVGLRLGGKLDDGSEVDELQIDVTYRSLTVADDRTHRTTSRAPGGRRAGLPIELAVTYPDGAGASGRIVVVARRDGRVVGFASDSVFVSSGAHQAKVLDLEPSRLSRCFNGIKDSSEEDVDCGGSTSDCPACGPGRVCFSNDDCANALCVGTAGSRRCGGS
jgi:hypothetical protein